MSTDEHTDPALDVGLLQQLLLETENLEGFLHEVTVQAVGASPATLSCGLTVRTSHKRPYTVGSSDAISARLDQLQYANDDGPCLYALRTGEIVDLDGNTSARWPDFYEQASREGITASISVPVIAREQVVGALNVYAREPTGVTAAERDRFRRVADRAAGAIALASRLAEHERLNTDLQAALTSRSTIDQALGILMGQQRCTADEAFATLRQASQYRNIKLRELAAEIITKTSGAPPQPGPQVD